jgi:hypothetical protein
MILPSRLPKQIRRVLPPHSGEKVSLYQQLARRRLRDAEMACVLITNSSVAAATYVKNHWRPTMKTNEGNLDRVLRVVAGLVLIGLAATGKVGLWGYIGVVPLLTGAVGFCPLYTVLGLNTCPVRR